MPRDGECPRCGWVLGSVPVAQSTSPDGRPNSTFVAERRHRFHAAAGLLATVIGIVGFFAGITEGGATIFAGILVGLPVAFAGVVSLKITRFGRYWWGLEPQDKTKALPGIVLGSVTGILVIPALIAAFVLLKLVDFRDSF